MVKQRVTGTGGPLRSPWETSHSSREPILRFVLNSSRRVETDSQYTLDGGIRCPGKEDPSGSRFVPTVVPGTRSRR